MSAPHGSSTTGWQEHVDAGARAARSEPAPCLRLRLRPIRRPVRASCRWPKRRDLVLRAPFILELRNVPFRQQEQMLFCVVDRLPRFSHGKHDARGNGQFLAEYAVQRYGAHADRGRDAQRSPGIWRTCRRLKARFEDRTILLPRDADVKSDYRQIKHGARHSDGAGRRAHARRRRRPAPRRHRDRRHARRRRRRGRRRSSIGYRSASTGRRFATEPDDDDRGSRLVAAAARRRMRGVDLMPATPALVDQ